MARVVTLPLARLGRRPEHPVRTGLPRRAESDAPCGGAKMTRKQKIAKRSRWPCAIDDTPPLLDIRAA